MNADQSVCQILHACVFVLKTVWHIDKKRIFIELCKSFCSIYEYLLYGAFFTQIMLSMAGKNVSFQKMMLLVWGLLLFLMAGHLFTQYAASIAGPMSDTRFYEGMNRMLYKKACQVDLACFEDSEFYNEYMMAVREAKKRVPKMLHDFCDMIVAFSAALVGFYLIFQLDRYALLFILFPVLGNFLFNGLLSRRLFQRERESVVFVRIADYVNRTIHLADYAKEIRLSNVFSLLRQKYECSVEAEQKVIGRYAFKNMFYFICFQYFTFTLLINGSFLYAAYRTLVSGTMVFAEMAVFQNFMRSNTWNFLYSAQDAVENVKNSFYINQIQAFLNYVPKVPEDADGWMPRLPIQTITFSHVSFGYRKGHPVLKDICLTLKAGEHAAIVGFNGSGKSTLIKLLLRLYDPDEGTIFVNGTDIRQYQLRAYRALFAAAFQDGKIFADTAAENILMGVHTTKQEDDEKIWRALRLAGMDEEVRTWDKQEQTILTKEFSNEGRVLSGGQSQKLLAARAFAKDCPIAIFDEPSSALDPISEYHLFQNILRYSEQRMLFFISHRLSSVRDADVVFFLENGSIKERGNHASLMEQNGKYAKLYRTQAQNYKACIKEQYHESV